MLLRAWQDLVSGSELGVVRGDFMPWPDGCYPIHALTPARCLEQCLAHGRHSRNVGSWGILELITRDRGCVRTPRNCMDNFG